VQIVGLITSIDISESELLFTFSLGWWFFGHSRGSKRTTVD